MPPVLSGNVPWFMLNLSNGQLITSRSIPLKISDTKEIIVTETPVPGLNYQPMVSGGFGNRHINFRLILVRRDAIIGVVPLIKQFEMLRNQVMGLLPLPQKQFNPGPKVLYQWGTGSVPLVYEVKRVDFEHDGVFVNGAGMPQYSEVQVELILDESDPIYQTEELFRVAMSVIGTVQNQVPPRPGRTPY